MKIYKVLRSSGWLQVEKCGHTHQNYQDALDCAFNKNMTSEYKNWIVASPAKEGAK